MSEKGLWVGQSGPSLMNGVPRCSTQRLFSTEILCLSGELLEKKSENSAVLDSVDLAEGKNKNLVVFVVASCPGQRKILDYLLAFSKHSKRSWTVCLQGMGCATMYIVQH